MTMLPIFDQTAINQKLTNEEAERLFLAHLFSKDGSIQVYLDVLTPEHFMNAVHRRIFSVFVKCTEAGKVVTIPDIKQRLGILGDVEGGECLDNLAALNVSAEIANESARYINDLFLRRELVQISSKLLKDVCENSNEITAFNLIAQSESAFSYLWTIDANNGGFQNFGDAVCEAMCHVEEARNRQGKLSGVPTGLVDLDSKLGGMQPSDLLILAGRPSMGKTALAVNIAFNAAMSYSEELDKWGYPKAVDGAKVAFFSMEMSAEQLATRILAQRAEVPSYKIRHSELSQKEFERLTFAAQDLHRLKLYIDDTPALSISAICNRSRRLKRKEGLGLIIVDNLQMLCRSAAKTKKRMHEVSQITRGLKALAKELNVPVILLSQLSRSVEKREDNRPQLSDLREFESIEPNADVVMFVYREQYYLERSEPVLRPIESNDKFNERHSRWMERCEEVHNTAEVIVAKQRHGPVGTVLLAFLGEYTKFGNLVDASHYDSPME